VRHILCDIEARRSGLSRSQMQVRVDTDDHIDSNDELANRVEGVVEGSLERYRDRVVLVQVHLSRLVHVRAPGRMHHLPGERDMCCRMEALAGTLSPIVVSHEALTLTEAIHAAAAKLERAVHDAFKRLKPHVVEEAERLGHVGSS
jgi:sigma 54 modulation/S30EA-like ribosomal protein